MKSWHPSESRIEAKEYEMNINQNPYKVRVLDAAGTFFNSIRNRFRWDVLVLLIAGCSTTLSMAQSTNLPALLGVLFPTNPTSADTIKLSLGEGTCGGSLLYVGNSYTLSMEQNTITLRMGARTLNPVPLCPPIAYREEIEIGKLPAGNYTLLLTTRFQGGAEELRHQPLLFTVTDARASKLAPYVPVDYSGQWWDPADSGWGLFIWQDAKSPRDSIFAAWFTYTPDGKSAWYTFQPTWQTATTTTTAPLALTSRLAGSTSPPPTPTSFVPVGTASLDFTIPSNGTVDTGKITYTFTNGPTLTRNIQRFRP